MAGEEVVRRDGAAEGQFQMGMDVDTAGQEQSACGIDHVHAFGGQIEPDQRHSFVLNQEIGLYAVGGGDDRSVLDHSWHIGFL